MTPSPLLAAVFASGGGSNLQALMDHAAGRESWRVALVISDRQGAGALERARRAGVPWAVIPTRHRPPAEVAGEMLDTLEHHGVHLVLLAGYLKLVPPQVVARFPERMLNIHPALLPSFGGKGMYGIHVHRAVLESGARLSGPTVHLVDEVYDRGRILAQWPVPVHEGDTPEALATRVLKVEHLLYPRVVDHVCHALTRDGPVTPMDVSGDAWVPARAPDLSSLTTL
ncbi:MAG: phosphoribosylglycinamide formyltransferase [Gemmatimonadota bacterium]